jgi:hypothetical protein
MTRVARTSGRHQIRWRSARRSQRSYSALGEHRASGELAAALVDLGHAHADDRDLGPRVQQRELALQALGRGVVVGVLDGDDRRSGIAQRDVQRARDADVALERDRPHPGVPLGGAARDVRRRVVRAVVDDDELQVGDGLREQRVDGALERRRAVVRADDGGDARAHAAAA